MILFIISEVLFFTGFCPWRHQTVLLVTLMTLDFKTVTRKENLALILDSEPVQGISCRFFLCFLFVFTFIYFIYWSLETQSFSRGSAFSLLIFWDISIPELIKKKGSLLTFISIYSFFSTPCTFLFLNMYLFDCVGLSCCTQDLCCIIRIFHWPHELVAPWYVGS